jgi:hypothetical protein
LWKIQSVKRNFMPSAGWRSLESNRDVAVQDRYRDMVESMASQKP